MSDIVERLRRFRPTYGWPEEQATVVTASLGDEAADEIERLRADNFGLIASASHYRAAFESTFKVNENLRARVAELEAAQEWRPLYDEAKDEWIAPADVDVLLFMPSTHPQLPAEIKAGFARSTKGGWFAGWATHWMPLPAPPKEGT